MLPKNQEAPNSAERMTPFTITRHSWQFNPFSCWRQSCHIVILPSCLFAILPYCKILQRLLQGLYLLACTQPSSKPICLANTLLRGTKYLWRSFWMRTFLRLFRRLSCRCQGQSNRPLGSGASVDSTVYCRLKTVDSRPAVNRRYPGQSHDRGNWHAIALLCLEHSVNSGLRSRPDANVRFQRRNSSKLPPHSSKYWTLGIPFSVQKRRNGETNFAIKHTKLK